MRKILSLLLCLTVCVLALASCADEIIGEDLPGYLEENPNTERELFELDFYIRCFWLQVEVVECRKQTIIPLNFRTLTKDTTPMTIT